HIRFDDDQFRHRGLAVKIIGLLFVSEPWAVNMLKACRIGPLYRFLSVPLQTRHEVAQTMPVLCKDMGDVAEAVMIKMIERDPCPVTLSFWPDHDPVAVTKIGTSDRDWLPGGTRHCLPSGLFPMPPAIGNLWKRLEILAPVFELARNGLGQPRIVRPILVIGAILS